MIDLGLGVTTRETFEIERVDPGSRSMSVPRIGPTLSCRPLEHENLTGSIIRCAMRVHGALGPGFLESVYQAESLQLRRRSGTYRR